LRLTQSKKRPKKLLKSKKGQVRGIDFALALLIFIIAFSQVIIVLSNLLIPSLVQMETYSQEQELNKIYSNVFGTQGLPVDWGTISTNDLTNYRIGLLENSENLDFTKINRLSTGISSYWSIDYIRAKTSLGLVRDFAIEIYSPITITINTVSIAFNTIIVKGTVTEYQTPIEGADVWIFSIDTGNNVATNYTQTHDISGEISFTSTLNVNVAGYYTIVAFAEVAEIYKDYTLVRYEREEAGLDYYPIDFDLSPFVRENSGSISCSADVSFDRTTLSDEADVAVVFPFSGFDVSFYTTNMQQVNNIEGQLYLAENVMIPSDGVAVVVVQEREGTTYRAGYMGVPMFLTEAHGGAFGPVSELSSTTYISTTKTLFIRNMLIKCQMWYW
jgi:hypothetical protein